MIKNQAITEESDKKIIDERSKRIRDRDVIDLQNILSTPGGRRFIWRYLQFCRVFAGSMTGNTWTYYNEGQRNVGLKLLSEVMDAMPEAYAQMTKESKESKEDL